VLPVPVPAVANVVKDSGLKLQIIDCQGEFVTPTGAAIAAAICTTDKLPETFSIEAIGLGAGKREYQRPSLLRAMIISDETNHEDVIWKLESNIDDCSGETFGYVMDALMDAGARDVHYIPVFMKKNRPAYQLNVICTEDKIEELEQIMFQETTTIGIRRQKMERTILPRTIEEIQTKYGMAKVKVCTMKDQVKKYPEYESVKEISKREHVSYQDVYQEIVKECYGK
jgi:uncharacterized protein (TIGR00299 family) protein